jgi:hypothetical protein
MSETKSKDIMERLQDFERYVSRRYIACVLWLYDFFVVDYYLNSLFSTKEVRIMPERETCFVKCECTLQTYVSSENH